MYTVKYKDTTLHYNINYAPGTMSLHDNLDRCYLILIIVYAGYGIKVLEPRAPRF